MTTNPLMHGNIPSLVSKKTEKQSLQGQSVGNWLNWEFSFFLLDFMGAICAKYMCEYAQ